MDRALVQKLAQKHANGETITITVDYSCLDQGEEHQQAMATLLQWAEEGLIDIKAAEQISNEFERANPNVKPKLEEQYLRVRRLCLEDPAIIGMGRIGRFRIGGAGTVRNGRNIYYYFEEFKNIMFPQFDRLSEIKRVNAYYDVMHVSTHYILGRDIFLTKDNHFGPKDKGSDAEELRKKWEMFWGKFEDLIILTPEDCVEILDDIFRSKKGRKNETGTIYRAGSRGVGPLPGAGTSLPA